MKLLGSEKLFWSVLKEYYRVIEKKASLIAEYEREGQWKEYTIEVHALKSASRQIGALDLAALAERMEAAGNAGETNIIQRYTPVLLEKYCAYERILAPYFKDGQENTEGTKEITADVLEQQFAAMRVAMDELDFDKMEEVISEMEKYTYDDDRKQLFERLKNAVEDIDTERCEKILAEWETKGL